VLDKELPQDRKFGLMTGCDHAFCLGCIRAWRGQANSGGGAGGASSTDPSNPFLDSGPLPAEAARARLAAAAVAFDDDDDDDAGAGGDGSAAPAAPGAPTPDSAALRSCPLCRQPTHFVVPALAWPESEADKEAVVAAYKARLAQTDCSHFSRGQGRCPFGTSCFYRHAYADGTLERRDLPPDLKRAADADGALRVLAPVTLSSFFETAAARRALRGSAGRGRGRGGASAAAAGGGSGGGGGGASGS
jgi:hypothetical protein